jgi:hypothetical protein
MAEGIGRRPWSSVDYPWRTRALRDSAVRKRMARESERLWGNALALLGLANREREQQGGAEGMDARRFGGVCARAWLPRTGQVSPVEALHRARGGQRCG